MMRAQGCAAAPAHMQQLEAQKGSIITHLQQLSQLVQVTVYPTCTVDSTVKLLLLAVGSQCTSRWYALAMLFR